VERRTRITLSIPWDDETQDHPASWGWDVLISNLSEREVHVVDHEEVDEQGHSVGV